jgi:uncharacterized FlaG/YvyC family protein
MTTASSQEIKKELRSLEPDQLQELCMRLAKYKKENKELLNYLLFEAQNEQAFVTTVKDEVNELFKTIPSSNVYLIKKSLRKTLRFANRQIKYSGIKKSELEIRIFFCTKMKQAKIPRIAGTILFNLYQQQIKKIESALAKFPEDIRGDYDRELNYIKS